MSIGLHDYKFGKKNNWRRWSWNRCIERISVDPKDAIVLYLPSRQNLDMRVATSKGIRPQNMFAIEKDKQAVRHLRRNRVNVIDGDLTDVLSAWIPPPAINIIHADFCSPLNLAITMFILNMMGSHGLSPVTVVAANLLRGRDAITNGLRGGLRKHFGDESIEGKHRGYQFMMLMKVTYTKLYKEVEESQENINASDVLADWTDLDTIRWNTLWKPVFNSYRSTSGQIMDSVVFNHFSGSGRSLIEYVGQRNGWERVRQTPHGKLIANRSAAAKAIRTMRLEGR